MDRFLYLPSLQSHSTIELAPKAAKIIWNRKRVNEKHVEISQLAEKAQAVG